MVAVVPKSISSSTVGKDNNSLLEPPKELDAGALFVLKSRGSWLHCGYHLTTSIAAPALLSLPYAMGFQGWVGGVVCLVLASLVTFYSYNLLSLVLDHHAQLGRRQLRFRDMASDILAYLKSVYGGLFGTDAILSNALAGPRWGKYVIGPLQFGICYGAVIAGAVLGGQNLKLYQFISIFGILLLFLAQIPSFHSLRHINLASLILCLAYSACVTAGSIHIGYSKNAPIRDYSLKGSEVNRAFSAVNAVSIIATTYACGIIPEIQATIAPPVKGKMFKGLCVCYTVILTTFFSVAISGYWVFGNQSMGTILANFMGNGKPLLPTWFLLMTNVFTLLQISAVAVVYLQPTNEVFEKLFADPKKDQFSIRNVAPRLILRSLSVIVGTLFAAMLPFFGDIMALFGAFGCIPLDFIFPMVVYNVTFKPSKRGIVFWGNTLIAVASSALSVLGAVASVRQIVLDAKAYRLFADV
ncbi:hypothetical protein FH972_011216 [Carpinus fangiana]|uniref:Amino acid transporter transmembrane domain-containing protein n=1 Tax=Carpinus fangiana TaxID=176857 RepID=A0A660KTM2_9ROSI|nr:hypothetical protein FH972_011216 [Carpinus fangiana]